MSDFKLVNITDSMLEDIDQSVTLPVLNGAASNNFQTFNSQSSTSTNQLQFNVVIPSLQTVVDRNFQINTDVLLKVTLANNVYEPNQNLFTYGITNALQAFPLNSLFTTIQSNINDANVTVTTREVLAPLLKMYNYKELATYSSLCPSLPDSFYYHYEDGLMANNNVLANYSNAGYTKVPPRGVFPVTIYDNNMTQIGMQILATDTGAIPFPFFYIKFNTTEPLMFLSPYISAHSTNNGGFLGINNLTITANMGDATRVMSNASYATIDVNGTDTEMRTISNVTFENCSNSRLLLNFLTVPSSLYSKLEPKNCLNFNQFTTYNYSSASTIPSKSQQTVPFSATQLNQIPSKIMIFARKKNMDTYDSNSFLCIKGVSINFCNQSGLLSSASQSQLYNISLRNGLQSNYYEFSGSGVTNDFEGVPGNVATTGSILVLDPSLDLSLPPQYANGSGGQFNIQFDVQLFNQTDEDITPTIYMLVVNTGIFSTDNGSSTYTTGLLTQEQILDTKSQDAMTDSATYFKKIVGGTIENLGSVHKHLKSAYKNVVEKAKALDTGSGMAASGMAASGISRRQRKYN
jgi:hypothetical protein